MRRRINGNAIPDVPKGKYGLRSWNSASTNHRKTPWAPHNRHDPHLAVTQWPPLGGHVQTTDLHPRWANCYDNNIDETRDERLARLLRSNIRETPDRLGSRTTVWVPLLYPTCAVLPACGGQMLRSHGIHVWRAKGRGNRLFALIIKMRSQT